MEEIIYQRDYTQYKQELRTELEKTSEGFVRIGYLLKVARDTDILVGSGYKDYLDFANGEFGLDKSMVSRFIRINDRFSEEGNSDRLLEQYKGFGYAKLAIMLRIPEIITEELTPEYSKSEIQAIKNEIDEERSKSEVEHLEENFEQIMNPPTDSLLVRVLKAIGEDNAALFCKIWNYFSENVEWGGLKDIFKPIDQQTYVTRVAGEGKIILIVKDEGAALTIARSEQKTNHSWNEINSAWAEIMPVSNGQEGHSFTEAKDAYEFTYGKPIEEEKPEVAPVQPKRVEVPKKAEPKKETPKKVIKEPEPVEAEPADDSKEETERQRCDPEPEEVEDSGLIKNDESEVEEVKGEIVENEENEVDPRGQLIVNTQININRAKFFIDEEVKHINSNQQILTENLIKCKQELEKAIREIEEVIR
jgi:outer membrane biosynthesis protein TonB